MNRIFQKLKVYPVGAHSLDAGVLLMLKNATQYSPRCRLTEIALSFSSAATIAESVSFFHSLLDTFTQKVNPSVMLHAILFCLPVTLPTLFQLCHAAFSKLDCSLSRKLLNLLFSCNVNA